jgi:hypothetical protein
MAGVQKSSPLRVIRFIYTTVLPHEHTDCPAPALVPGDNSEALTPYASVPLFSSLQIVAVSYSTALK